MTDAMFINISILSSIHEQQFFEMHLFIVLWIYIKLTLPVTFIKFIDIFRRTCWRQPGNDPMFVTTSATEPDDAFRLRRTAIKCPVPPV